MREHSKALTRLLREHVRLAHEEELRRALLPLANDFDRWRGGELGSGELSERIHDFHQGPAREIWKTYNYGSPDLTLAYAINTGVLQRESLPPELLAALTPAVGFHASLDGDAMDGTPAKG